MCVRAPGRKQRKRPRRRRGRRRGWQQARWEREGRGRRSGQKAGDALRHRKWAGVVETEKAQFARVRAHDAFVGAGVDALRAHLRNTVCAEPARVPPPPPTTAPASGAKAMPDAGSQKPKAKPKAEPRPKASASAAQRESAADLRASERRAAKQQQAEQALRLGAALRGRVQKQSLVSLLGGQHGARRGRIGVKHPKLLH